MLRVLRCFTAQIRGVKTNIPFLENVLRHPEFLAGEVTRPLLFCLWGGDPNEGCPCSARMT